MDVTRQCELECVLSGRALMRIKIWTSSPVILRFDLKLIATKGILSVS